MLPFWIIFYRHTRNPRGVFSHFKPFKKSCFNIFKSSFYSIWTLLVYSILNHLFYNMTACWWSTLLATSFTLCQNPLLLWISNQESYGFPKKNINIFANEGFFSIVIFQRKICWKGFANTNINIRAATRQWQNPWNFIYCRKFFSPKKKI